MTWIIDDQQWMRDRDEAERLQSRLASWAAQHGKVIGIRPSGSGFLVTVEHEEEDELSATWQKGAAGMSTRKT